MYIYIYMYVCVSYIMYIPFFEHPMVTRPGPTQVIGSQQKSAQWPTPSLGPWMARWLPQFPSGRWQIYLGVA